MASPLVKFWTGKIGYELKKARFILLTSNRDEAVFIWKYYTQAILLRDSDTELMNFLVSIPKIPPKAKLVAWEFHRRSKDE